MKEQNKNKLKFLGFLTNTILLVIAIFFSFSVIRIDREESIETIAEYNGTIYAGNQQSNKVSLMINVYWGDEHLESILNTLKEYDLKTTFFVGGTWVNSNPTLAKKILTDGHEIGNHGMTHQDHSKLDFDQNYKQIQSCHSVVNSHLNYEMKLFAPPSGYYNKNTITAANNLGYKTIMWSKDTIDWRDKDSELCFTRATKNAKSGELILMHPTEHTLKALPNIIKHYKDNNFILTSVSDNLA